MKNSIQKTLGALAFGALFSSGVQAQSFAETFNDITTLAGSGWVMTNASVAVGSTNWFQGTSVAGGGPFDAFNGATNAYIGANYNNTGSVGTISNWLMTPNRTFRNGDVITFYTRKVSPDTYADRLEVRMSTNGASTSVGTGAAVGDYTTLLLSVNPALVLGVYPTAWTQYTITISGLPAPTSGRIAFRYFVTNAGFSGTSSDYIGIDQVNYTPYVCPAFTMTAGGALTGATAGAAYSTSLTQTGALGTPTYALTAGALPPGVTLSASGTITGTPTATGTFNFTATVSDASGCTGSQSYSITTVCPPNPTALSGLPTVCSNAAAVSLTQGSPAGGTYSGTGVTGGSFDPATGTQTITYNYTNPYGCAYATSSTLTVNMAPAVTQSPVAAACDNTVVTLTGASPAGGTYSGTGITGTSFDASVGTQTLSYAYTDGNGCSNTTAFTVTVFVSPTVSQTAYSPVCDDAGTVALAGGSPAGGTYTGTGVTGASFDVAMGTQTLNYAFTDANGCTNDADFTITVNPLPVVSQAAVTTVCQDANAVTLTGGAPAGGVYTNAGGTSITSYDPGAGTQTLNYAYTDANGCTNDVDFVVTVNPLPTVTQGTIAAVCADNGPVALTGGSPAGGTYSGTGVTGTSFDPAAGTQTITYTFTDANGCMNTAATTATVNALPNVTLNLPVSTMCTYNAAVTLSGGAPAAGTFSGTGVTSGAFNPATAGAGTHVITYAFTDANGCDNTATDNIIVSACLGVDEAAETVFTVYPNPSAGLFTVTASGNLENAVITDLHGKVLQQLTGTNSELLIDLTQAQNGIYFLRGEVNGQLVSVRLVKN